MNTIKPGEDDVLECQPTTEKAKKPASHWFNWWESSRALFNPITGEIFFPGRTRSQIPYPSKDAAETAALEWFEFHERLGCDCGFGPNNHLGAHEDGKTP